ncbi:Unknown protein [Striga hermonthica]|uniref:F-box domain-containing protein n=1 Tax=Striga hermonthica TaxID=68872 RepID=A0A9N7MP75_STRHE|nr:Unknown protein [Striga hermonthica]
MASIDMLSALPDEILSHILSFLSFKTSVSTSTLAARWRRLWAYAPNIQFTEDSVPCSISERTNFLRKLTNIVSQCESHGVNTLRFNMFYFDEHEVEACLESAFARNVKIVDLTFPYYIHSMSPCIFTSKTLVDLRIKHLHIEMNEGAVCLPALKRLRLDYVRLGCSLESLISGCPVLEDLTLGNCLLNDGENGECHCISSPIMKRLVLHCFLPSTSRLKMDTPALEYLELRFIKPYNLSVGPMASLIEVHIVVCCFYPIENDNLYSRSLVELVGRFSNVKAMKLTIPEKKMGETLHSPMANSIMKLDNLTKLEVEVDWWFLAYFLEKADKLKVLIIRNVYHKDNRLPWLSAPLQVPLQVPNCMSSHLKIVQIHELDGTDEHELDMVRYLLKNAKVLERMELHWCEEMERHCIAELIGRISSFDRGSEMCEIVFNEYLELGKLTLDG